MRRRGFITAAGGIVIAGCGSSGGGREPDDDDPTRTETTTTATTEDTTTPPPDEEERDTTTAASVLASGETFEARQRSLTVHQFEIYNSVVHGGEGEMTAADGEVLLLVRVTGTNTADEADAVPSPRAIAVHHAGQTYSPYQAGNDFASGKFREPFVAPAYEPPESVDPGASRSGWLLFELPRDVRDVRLVWQPRGTATQAAWRAGVDPSDLPAIGFTGLSVPEESGVGSSTTLGVAFENEGGTAGKREFTYRVTTPTGGTTEATTTVTVPANGSKTWTTSVAPRALGEIGLSVPEYDASATVPVGPASLPLTGTLRVPDGPDVSVANTLLADAYSYEAYGGSETVEPDPGKQFAFVELVVENPTDGPVVVPGENDVRVGGNEPVDTPQSSQTHFVEPTDGLEYTLTRAPELEASGSAGGWLAFQVDADASAVDAVEVEWDAAWGTVAARFGDDSG